MFLLLLLFTFPSTFGCKGIYRTKSADAEWLLEARSILVINVDAEAYRYDYDDTTYDYGSARIGIAYTPTKRIETYTLWRGHGQGSATLPFGESQFEGDIGDIDVGGKIVLKKIKNSYLGADLACTLPIGHDIYSNNGFIIYPKCLGTFDIGDYWRLFPVRWHLNVGIPLGRAGLSENFPVTFATAFELPSKIFTYFMELSRNHERDWNWRFSPGFRFHPFYRFSLTVAADLGLTEDYRLIGVNAGLSINSALTREREILPTGNIAGEIKDKNTKSPIEADIKILELEETVSSNREYGIYKIVGIPKGIYTLLVEAPDYATETRIVTVKQDETNELNFDLIRASITYTGLVLNNQTNQGIDSASVIIDGETKVSAQTDSYGTFSEILKPGEYEIKVNKQNHVQFIRKLFINADRFDTIMLKPIEAIAEVPEAIIYFDLDDANIRDDQRAVLDPIAEFLKSHPRVRCELRGHTDPSGNIDYNEILSLARANSVKDYLVKVHGVEKNRISTLAFSKTKLVKESPEKSRRVEIFLIK